MFAKDARLNLGLYTVGECAAIFGVAGKTIQHWCDSGLLKCHRFPQGRDRRVSRAELVRFSQKHGVPVALHEPTRILGIGLDSKTAAMIRGRFTDALGYWVASVGTAFDAGLVFAHQHPQCVVIDFAMGCNEARSIAESIRRDTRARDTRMVALLCDDSTGEPTFDAAIKRPWRSDDLANAILV